MNEFWLALPAYLAGPPPLLRSPLESYRRQYVGFKKDGHRYLYLNAIDGRSLTRSPWREHPMLYGDGGNRYFGVEYDVNAKKPLHYESNGW